MPGITSLCANHAYKAMSSRKRSKNKHSEGGKSLPCSDKKSQAGAASTFNSSSSGTAQDAKCAVDTFTKSHPKAHLTPR